MNIHSFLIQVGLALPSAALAFLATAGVEWWLHAKLLHEGGVPAHAAHHDDHAKADYKSLHPDEKYGVLPIFIFYTALGMSLIGAGTGWLAGHMILVGATACLTSIFYFWAFEVVHRRVHEPKDGGWFETTRLYRYLDRAHHVHHGREDRNFCIIFPPLDWLMGTLHNPHGSNPVPTAD